MIEQNIQPEITGLKELRSANLRVMDIGIFKNQLDGKTIIDRSLIQSMREESKTRKDSQLKSLELYSSKNYQGVIDLI